MYNFTFGFTFDYTFKSFFTLIYNFTFGSTFIYIIDLAFNYMYKSYFTMMYNFTFSSTFIYIIDLAFNYTFKSYFTLMYNFTFRSIQERAEEHWGAAKRGEEKSHIVRHQALEHVGEPPAFLFKVISNHKTALSRQIKEAVRICRRGEQGGS